MRQYQAALLGRGSGKNTAFLKAIAERMDDEMMKHENGYKEEETLKFMDEHGEIKAEIPADSELLNAIVGYAHDPQTHVYNRSERRRIIKAAKELDKKYKKKGGK